MWKFILIALTIWGALHVYAFWRIGSVPMLARWLPQRRRLILATSLWVSFPVLHGLSHGPLGNVTWPLELASNIWMGVLFLLVAMLLVIEGVTLGGWLFARQAPRLRAGALLMAGALSLIALVQGLRAPVVRTYDIAIPGLATADEGRSFAVLTDLHLGLDRDARWLERRISQVQTLHPDAVLIVGDLIDADVGRVEALLPVLQTLRAPLGVWAVLGNHDTFTGADRSARLFRAAGFTLLRDECAPLTPGLSLAGVDDLGLRRREAADHVRQTLAKRPATSTTLLLSHSPLAAATAATSGARLMLSGHTHGGQIWPFSLLVGQMYPLLAGEYRVADMPVIVSRGTGLWGPPMRLWQPGEILLIRLHAQR